MDRFIRGLKSKKGFTMIELIVVIAIIGVLAAMIIPAMTYDDTPTKAKGYAKDMFYKTQSAMANLKIIDGTALASDTLFYVDMNLSGTITESGIVEDYNGTFTRKTVAAVTTGTGYTDAFKNVVSKFQNNCSKYLSPASITGTLYAVVDKDFNVQCVYWTDADTATIAASDKQLEDDDLIDGYYCCAYPQELSKAGQEMFVY